MVHSDIQISNVFILILSERVQPLTPNVTIVDKIYIAEMWKCHYFGKSVT